MKSLAPIVLFTYNRLDHTKRTVEALLRNTLAENSDIYIFSDGARKQSDVEKVEEVRAYLTDITGFKNIYLEFSKNNKGLASSIIEGVSSVFEKNEKVIVLEDDLETSPYFLKFMNETLEFYSPDDIWSIAGYAPNITIPKSYKYSTFLIHRNCSWGWATWKQNWQKTDWQVKDFESFIVSDRERKKFNRGGDDLSVMLLKQQQEIIHSWSIRFNYAAFKNCLPTVYPINSMVKNLGVDGTGTNMKSSKKYHTDAFEQCPVKDEFCSKDIYNHSLEREFKSFYNTSLYRRLINNVKIHRYINKLT